MRLRALLTLLIIGGLIGGLITYFIVSPKNEETKVEISHNMIVQKVEALGNLEVIRYSIQDIIEYKKVREWLPNAKTVLVVTGEVIGCVDLTKIRDKDIYTAGDSIRITLPAPEICHSKIDHSKSHIYDIEYGLWESEKITDEAYRYAEKELYAQALKMDFAPKSRENTIQLLHPILQSMGFNHIMITFRSETSENNKYSFP
ncbi:DUF4230 domain-containing protein [Dysgonomonas sp. ZJ709]|uniref:DUF4230 domain-containing protein n=1 Tax=Dysgonomonas sp. ZJ709 TaxID=2709797 RepID=UPI0013E9F9CB|nr:DUF4230 domain-containing protein [Dysgonomonas sp. ZJ709]